MALLSPVTDSRPAAGAIAARRDVPANPRAFELFLRGMEEARTLDTASSTGRANCSSRPSTTIRDFAPAWAALGRCHRVLRQVLRRSRASDRLAEQAFQRALELSPDLPLAHRYYTHFESEHGRAADAIARPVETRAAPIVTTRSCSPGWCTPAATPACSMRRSPRTTKPCVSIRTSRRASNTRSRICPSGVESSRRRVRPATIRRRHLSCHGARHIRRRARQLMRRGSTSARCRRHFGKASMRSSPPSQAATRRSRRARSNRPMAAHVDPEALFLFGAMLTRAASADRGLEVWPGAVRSGYTPAATLRRTTTRSTACAIATRSRRWKHEARAAMRARPGRCSRPRADRTCSACRPPRGSAWKSSLSAPA